MKSATLPSLRVEPQPRDAAESLLLEGETLSSLIETSVRETIERRLWPRGSSWRTTTTEVPTNPVHLVHPVHPGSTAVTSISTSARSSISALTCTALIAAW